MSGAEKETVLVLGAGLAGALMGAYLGRAGYNVEIYERRADPRGRGPGGGRSINLALSTRGIAGLAGVGLDGKVLERATPMKGRMIHAPDGKLTFQPYGTEKGQVINSVSRGGLNLALIEAAANYPNVRLFFGKQVVGVNLDGATVDLVDAETGEPSVARGDVVIGADGAFSALRARMQRLDRFDFQQSFLGHGYKELTIPPGPGGKFLLQRNALHIWPRGGFMMIALPNPDGSFTCTLFWPFEGPNSFADLRTEEDVLSYFEEVFPDAVPVMPTLSSDYFANPTSSLVTIRCRPWHYGGKAALIGDACHAVVPFYGQGANAAFEDCLVLDDCIRRHAPDWERVFAEYDQARKDNVDTLADLALANFVEMRDHVGSVKFRIRKKLERLLHVAFPRLFLPLYTMVTFTRMPYTQAVRRAKLQDRVLRILFAAKAAVLLLLLFLVFSALWM